MQLSLGSGYRLQSFVEAFCTSGLSRLA